MTESLKAGDCQPETAKGHHAVGGHAHEVHKQTHDGARHSEHSNHSNHSNHSHAAEKMQAEINAARQAWADWQSGDCNRIGHALDEKDRISAKAWKEAMRQIDLNEPCRDSKVKTNLPEAKLPAAPVVNTAEAPIPQPADLIPPPPPPPQIIHPGYAPYSRFAPPAPISPAYDLAYNQPPAPFYGLDLGVVRLGVRGGSLDLGVNAFGLARTELQVGQRTGVDAEFLPLGGPLHARAGSGIAFDRYGAHAEVGAGANFFDIVNGDADFGAHLGESAGVNGKVRGKAFPVQVEAGAGADVGPGGADAYTAATTGLTDAFQVRAGGRVAADSSPNVAAGVGVVAGRHTLDFGPSVGASPNQGNVDNSGSYRGEPRIHLEDGLISEPTFYPTVPRNSD